MAAALCLISMTQPVGGGINETPSHGEADQPPGLQCVCRSTTSVSCCLSIQHTTTEGRQSVKEVTDIRLENIFGKGYKHGEERVCHCSINLKRQIP
jgi:hypothetical protein